MITETSPIVLFLVKLIKRGLEYYNRYYSCYRAYVVDIDDPEGLARLKVVVPEINGEAPITNWALPFNTYAGKGYGSYNLPQVGDIVWVQFEKGNAEYPLWSYSYFGRKEMPEEFKGPTVKGFKTPLGHILYCDDDPKNPFIKVQHTNKLSITLDNEGITIWGKDKDITIKNENSQVQLVDTGVVIDTTGDIWLNGDKEVLYNTIPGASAILDVSQIGIAKNVKVG